MNNIANQIESAFVQTREDNAASRQAILDDNSGISNKIREAKNLRATAFDTFESVYAEVRANMQPDLRMSMADDVKNALPSEDEDEEIPAVVAEEIPAVIAEEIPAVVAEEVVDTVVDNGTNEAALPIESLSD